MRCCLVMLLLVQSGAAGHAHRLTVNGSQRIARVMRVPLAGWSSSLHRWCISPHCLVQGQRASALAGQHLPGGARAWRREQGR